MIVDALELPDGTELETDVCIIGAGPAGITLAREMLDQSFRVCLVESGGTDFDPSTQELQRLLDLGGDMAPPMGARRRQFGGAATAWNVLTTEEGGGVRYLPFDDFDFEERPWVAHSGWPISRADVDPYYRRAQQVCAIGPYTYRVEDWETTDTPRWKLDDTRVHTSIEQFGLSRTFTGHYLTELRASESITVLTHANAGSLQERDASDNIEQVQINCINGSRLAVKASIFVLATGGIENARLLLVSRARHAEGVGNQNDVVGRFFMDHHNVYCGVLVPSSAEAFEAGGLYDLHATNGTWVMGKLNPTADVIRSEQLLNSAARFELRAAPSDLAARRSVQNTLSALRRGRLPEEGVSGVVDLVPHLPRLAALGALKVRERLFSSEKPSYRGRYGWSERSGKQLRYGGYSVELQVELAPDRENRVMLGDEMDRFGLPLAGVRWNWTDLDLRSVRRSQEIIASELSRAGLGQLDIPAWEDKPPTTSPAGIFHHLGATRMHADPKQGVVDPDCRVHGVENLFVAGSSVFPTGGYANPTLTIVALSIRLADHVVGLMEERGLQVKRGAGVTPDA